MCGNIEKHCVGVVIHDAPSPSHDEILQMADLTMLALIAPRAAISL